MDGLGVINNTPAVSHVAECKALDAKIANYDAMARQPQSGQMQDWITAEKKKARDQQFELNAESLCQKSDFMSIESIPKFTDPAAALWSTIPIETKKLLLSNVHCGKCRRGVTITNFTGVVKAGDLLLVGLCSECRGDVARLLGNPIL